MNRKKVKKYPGQKKIFGVYHKIINEIPKHTHYYELFAGSGAIAKLLTQKAHAVYHLNDLDSKVSKKLIKDFPKATVTNQGACDIINTISTVSAAVGGGGIYFC